MVVVGSLEEEEHKKEHSGGPSGRRSAPGYLTGSMLDVGIREYVRCRYHLRDYRWPLLSADWFDQEHLCLYWDTEGENNFQV